MKCNILFFLLAAGVIGVGVVAPAPVFGQESGALPAAAVFDRLKALEGRWVGRSTKGWEEAVQFQTIAAGSVVLHQSFDAHPGEKMMTMFYLHEGRLMLTHFCVSGNQPRLAATQFEDDGRTVTFTFHDATGIASRDQGHMDKLVYRFIDEDHVTAQWTWYQDGSENWLEEIRLERTP